MSASPITETLPTSLVANLRDPTRAVDANSSCKSSTRLSSPSIDISIRRSTKALIDARHLEPFCEPDRIFLEMFKTSRELTHIVSGESRLRRAPKGGHGTRYVWNEPVGMVETCFVHPFRGCPGAL
jgi:hypothetical protein